MGLIMLLYLLFNSYLFQNYIVSRISKFVNNKFNTQISIGEISYDGWTYFSLRQVKFGDPKNDTTFYAGRLQFNIIGARLDSTHFILNDVVLDEGLCKITTYTDSTYSFDVLNYFSNPNDTSTNPNAPPFILELKNLEVMDTRFMMFDSLAGFSDEGFDPFRMLATDISFRSKRFVIYDDSLNFDLRNLTCKERCGFNINRLTGHMIICPERIEIKDMDLVTPNSHIKNYFSLNSKSWDDYDDFLNKVVLKGTLQQCEVDMKDVAYFAPALKTFHYKAKISGIGYGPISNLSMKNVVATMGSQTKFTGNVKLRGLPEITETFIEVKADYASTIREELEAVIDMKLPQAVGDLGKMVYRGEYTGFFNDFVSYGNIETQFGSVETDLNMKLNDKTMQSGYSGKLKVERFNLGAYLKNNRFGVVSLTANVNGEGLDLEHLNSKFEAQIDQMTLGNYLYQNAYIKGGIINKKLTAFVDIQDSNLAINSQIKATFGNMYTHYEMDGNLDFANLKALHFTKEPLTIGSDIFADFYFKNLNENYGTLRIENTHYEKNGYNYRINQLQLEAENGKEKSIVLNGDFIKATLKGAFNVTELYDQLYGWTSALGGAYFRTQPNYNNPVQDFKLNLNLITTASISPLFFPGYNVANTELEFTVNSKKKSYSLLGHAGSITLNEYQLIQTTVKLNEQGASEGELLLSIKQFGKNDTILTGDFALKARAEINHLDLQYYIKDSNSLFIGSFNHEIEFLTDKIVVNNKSSWIGSKGSQWEIAAGKAIEFNRDKLNFNNLTLTNNRQLFQIDGNLFFKGFKKDISLKVNNFDLNTINKFTKNISIALGGIANGYFVYKNAGQREVVLTNLKIEDLSLDMDTLGDYKFATGYQENEQKINIDFESLKGKVNNLKGSGTYSIQGKILDLDLSFNRSEISVFQAFVKDYVKLYSGEASLVAKLKGPVNDLKLNGNLLLSDARFRIEYLKTDYTLPDANLVLVDNAVKITPFYIYDINKNKAQITGEILHNGFSSFTYNIKVDQFKNFQVLNTTLKNNELYYGKAYASGNFTIKGSANEVQMNMNLTSEKGTKIYINPFGVSGEEGNTYINYVSYDTLETFELKSKSLPFGISMTININATPDAEIQMLFDSRSDDRIRAKGIGKLKLQLLPDGNFRMYGDYEVTEGDYRFSALGVVAKKFILRSGSSISWRGDPFTGQMRIVGIYNLKATIGEIVTLPKEQEGIRVPVECIININGSVDRPQLNFDLNFPDIQSSVTGSAASELNAVVSSFRRDPEVMNQQMLFLLISGSFIPITSSNNTNASSVGTQTVSDLLSKQAAGLIGKVAPGFNLNVDLLNAPDQQRGRTALISGSKLFYDNRLEVQVGVALDDTERNASASYKLRKSGNTKLKIFNKKGFDPIYNRNVTTSGLGLYYRKEFDSFIELFKKQNSYYN